MDVWKVFLYGLMPMGQLAMRMFEFNGSLDKSYLLFPLFLIPPFSFISILLGKFGYIKKLDKGKPLDIYVLIPIIMRFIFIILVSQITNSGMLLLQIGLVIGSLFIADLIRSYTTRKCEQSNTVGRMGKSIIDSMGLYGVGVLTVLLFKFIPFIGQILSIVTSLQIPYISQIVESLIWAIGLIAGYMIMNMLDENFMSDADYCVGKISKTRMIISIIVMLIAAAYQFKSVLF